MFSRLTNLFFAPPNDAASDTPDAKASTSGAAAKQVEPIDAQEKRSKKVRGIINNGNSCFRNVILQSLACFDSVSPAVSAFGLEPDSFVTQALAKFLTDLRTSSRDGPLTVPVQLNLMSHPALTSFFSQPVSIDAQQDAHEYFQLILAELAKTEAIASLRVGNKGLSLLTSSSNRVISKQSRTPAPSKGPFYGQLSTTVQCCSCSYVSLINNEQFNNISLPLLPLASSSLTSALEAFTRAEFLEGFRCRRCSLLATMKSIEKRIYHRRRKLDDISKNGNDAALTTGKVQASLTKCLHMKASLEKALRFNLEMDFELVEPNLKLARKRCAIYKYPAILVIHFKRTVNMTSGHQSKITTPIDFPEVLILTPETFAPLTTQRPKSGGTDSLSSSYIFETKSSMSETDHSSSEAGMHSSYMSRNSGSTEESVANSFEEFSDMGSCGVESIETSPATPPPSVSGTPFKAIIPEEAPRRSAITYNLQSAVFHYGDHERGHFFCSKVVDGQWYDVSDTNVSETRIEDVLKRKQEVYMLFYSQRVIKG